MYPFASLAYYSLFWPRSDILQIFNATQNCWKTFSADPSISFHLPPNLRTLLFWDSHQIKLLYNLHKFLKVLVADEFFFEAFSNPGPFGRGQGQTSGEGGETSSARKSPRSLFRSSGFLSLEVFPRLNYKMAAGLCEAFSEQ